jgi:hypothetical protein
MLEGSVSNMPSREHLQTKIPKAKAGSALATRTHLQPHSLTNPTLEGRKFLQSAQSVAKMPQDRDASPGLI